MTPCPVRIDLRDSCLVIVQKIVIEAWNIRMLYQYSQLENLKQEMNKLNINIIGVCEIRWASNGNFVSNTR